MIRGSSLHIVGIFFKLFRFGIAHFCEEIIDVFAVRVVEMGESRR